MKYSLSELKKLVKGHRKSIPMLSSGKNSLLAYALKHNLLEAEQHIKKEEMHEEQSKKERKTVKKILNNIIKEEKPIEKVVEKPVEVEVEVKKPKQYSKKAKQEELDKLSPKPIPKEIKEKSEPKKEKKMVHDLKEVQRIKKEKNVSLKEAWKEYIETKKKE